VTLALAFIVTDSLFDLLTLYLDAFEFIHF